jgi:His-Xaa-Ser system protein HxsD
VELKREGDGRLKLAVSRAVYSSEALLAAYRGFAEAFVIFVEETDSLSWTVHFQEKGESRELEEAISRYLSALADEQLRVNLEKRFGPLRDKIVEAAFSPLK